MRIENMSNKRDEAFSAMKIWQEKFQQAASDPQALKLLLEYQTRMQEIFTNGEQIKEHMSSESGSRQHLFTQLFDSVLQLTKRVEQLEARIRKLEQD